MSIRLCTIPVPTSVPERQRPRRIGCSYDLRRPDNLGHSLWTLITSIHPPRIRFWDPYVDVEISRADATLLLKRARIEGKNRGNKISKCGSFVGKSTIDYWNSVVNPEERIPYQYRPLC